MKFRFIFTTCILLLIMINSVVGQGLVLPPITPPDDEIAKAFAVVEGVAKKLGYEYQEVAKEKSIISVTALWKGKPVTNTIQFFRRDGNLFFGSSRDEPGDVALEKGGEQIDKMFYTALKVGMDTGRIDLKYDPNATVLPARMFAKKKTK